MTRAKMFFRVVFKTVRVRPERALLSLAALLVGATLASAFINLYFELPRKMTTEFRNLGPNLLVAPQAGNPTIPESVADEIASAYPNLSPLPWLYAVGTINQEEVILGGTALDALATLNPGWQISNVQEKDSGQKLETFLSSQAARRFPQEEGLLAGERAAAHFGWQAGQMVRVDYGTESITLPLLGVLSTGESADSQVLMPLATLQNLANKQGDLSLIQVAAPGDSTQVEQTRSKLAALITHAEIRPLRQVIESEAQVVLKIKGLMFGLTAIVLAIVILSVMTTVSGLVFDRRRDIGVLKALGGTDQAISLLLLAETTSLAVLATLLGYVLGFGLAQWASLRIFHSALQWRWDALPAVLVVTLTVALAGTIFPIQLVRRLNPAVVLKGE
ncbi:MAG: FtsX-like permease family protein [Acidobacteria bacterium]|nr:FtsX-like permease family protein [Acidobacteriota bacterium]